MSHAPKTEVSRILRELKRVRRQWFSNHADKQVLTDASAMIDMMSQYLARTTRPTDTSELVRLIQLLDQFIVSGKNEVYVGSNLERQVHFVLEKAENGS